MDPHPKQEKTASIRMSIFLVSLCWKDLHCYPLVMRPTSVARWVSISTAAGGGEREKLKLPRSKDGGEVRGDAPDSFRAPQRAGTDNPKVVNYYKNQF